MRAWRRRRPAQHRWTPPDPVPDNDQVLHPDDRRSAEILRAVLEEPTRPLPVSRPLLTPGQRWRSRGGRR